MINLKVILSINIRLLADLDRDFEWHLFLVVVVFVCLIVTQITALSQLVDLSYVLSFSSLLTCLHYRYESSRNMSKMIIENVEI